jgi:hypothetical protein
VALAGQQLQIQSAAGISGLQSGWKIVAVGDFNSDLREDLLRQSDDNNSLEICYMNGLALMSQQPLDPNGFNMWENPNLKPFIVGPR